MATVNGTAQNDRILPGKLSPGVVVASGDFTKGAGLDAKQVTHEEIHAPPTRVGALPHPMAPSRDNQQVEILVRLDQGVDHLGHQAAADVG